MQHRPYASQDDLERALDVARGKEPADLVLRGGKVLDVHSGKWLKGDVAISAGRVVGICEEYRGRRTVSVKGKYLVPGFIDSHVHIESSMMSPEQFQIASLPRGTTGAIIDPHEIANVLGLKGIEYMLTCAEKATMDLYVMLSSCVPATEHLETSGAKLSANDLLKYKTHPKVLGLAEMMNVPGVLYKDEEVLRKILNFQDQPIDGHCPSLTGHDLNAYIAAGIRSCHESVTLEEAEEKLQKGMQVLLREGSVAKNLSDLGAILTPYSSPCVSLCTDDRNPVDILDEGHMDHLIRLGIRRGLNPESVYRAASWSTAVAYGLKGKGEISPGADADIVVLDDYKKCKVAYVLKAGHIIKGPRDIPALKVPPPQANSVRCEVPGVADLKIRGQSGLCRVIEVIPHQIITRERRIDFVAQNGELKVDVKRDLLKIAVLERHGQNRPVAMGFVKGFGFKHGAIGSSVGHDSHNLVAVGTSDEDILECFRWLKENGGGFCAVSKEKVLASIQLPIAGLMTPAPLAEVYRNMKKLRHQTRKMGGKLDEPFLQLAFLCLPVIPELKITDLGLIDVVRFERVSLKV